MSGGCYGHAVRDRFASLPGAGPLPPGAGAGVSGEACDLARGGWVRLEARVLDGRLAACAFRAWGCPYLLAAASLATEALGGADPRRDPPPSAASLAARLDAPPERLGRLLLVEDAAAALLRAACSLG